MTQYCQCATDPRLVTIVGLPSIIPDIHTLSSDTCFGQFGQIICINIDLPNNLINIKYSTTTAAYNAIVWSNWMHSHNGWSQLQNKNNNVSQSEDIQTKQLQNEYNILLNKYEQMKQKQIAFENKETQFISTENDNVLEMKLNRMKDRMKQMKQNVNQTMREKDAQIKQLEAAKKESDETCYSTIVLNDNLLLQINRMKVNFNEEFQKKVNEMNSLKETLQKLEETKTELHETCYAAVVLNDNLLLQINRMKVNLNEIIQKKDNEINKLKERLQKLDKKYTNIFKQLVNRITENENEKHFRLSTRKQQTKNTQFEYESLKFELDEKYNDLCKLNDYIIELEEQLSLNNDDECYCKSWDVFEVYRWIITIKNKRFNKYKKDLVIGLRKYMIYGIKMGWLKDLDLVNMGIHSPTDRACLLAEINWMKQKYGNVNDTTCGQTEGY